MLLFTTEKHQIRVLAYDPDRDCLVTRASGSAASPYRQPSEVGHKLLVAPSGDFIALHCYDGLVRIIPVNERGLFEDAFDVRIAEQRLIDIVFLHPANERVARPTLAVLYIDPRTKDKRHVKTYVVALATKTLEHGPWNLPNVEDAAEILIPIPQPLGGVVVIGAQTIIYHDGLSPKVSAPLPLLPDASLCSLPIQAIPMERCLVTAWCAVEASHKRLLLGDMNGSLHVLVLRVGVDKSVSMKLERLGAASIAATLAYLGTASVFVGSALGDSMFVKLSSEPLPTTYEYVQVLERFTNVAPIVNFCAVDLDRQGQHELVTCSGAFQDGSLRVVRNGVGLNRVSDFPLVGIRGLWSLASHGGQVEQYLVLSFVGETRVLAMVRGSDVITETSELPLVNTGPTLYCTNVVDEQIVQVTRSHVHLIHTDASRANRVVSWAASGTISVSAATQDLVAVVVDGSALILLKVDAGSLKQLTNVTYPHEISALAFSPNGHRLAVSAWSDMAVTLLTVPALTTIRSTDLGGETVPRSLLFAQFETQVSSP